jgi:Sulfotransferase family/Aspartyl/Asparaginyl beta-hydroxylase
LKLPKPFFRLPVRFDAARLRAEVDAVPKSAWSRHPQEYPGNSAARLVTVGGTQNDFVAGSMQPTAALLASPYLQQVLAFFDTVWSRSRLMRIEAGGSVPLHSDTNHHWFYRVRVHVPVITRPEVRFFCGDQNVHMAAGEAWVFDNWRKHKVENPTPDARIHLVADTAGTSAFWRLVLQGESGGFVKPNPAARLVPFDPSARPSLQFEQFNVASIMPPSEVEQLTNDLLDDLAPADMRPESVAAVDSFIATALQFCHDWRTTWYVNGDSPQGRQEFEKLVNDLRWKLRELPPVLVASTGSLALAVLNARLLAVALGGGTGLRHEAAEFNVPAAVSFGTETVTLELPRVEMPTVEVPRIEANDSVPLPKPDADIEPAIVAIPEPKSSGPPVLERPIVILSAPRAGSTLLFETLAQAAGVYTIGGESHQLIESIAALRPGRGVARSNRLTRRDATSAIVAELRQRFASRIHDRDGQAPKSGAKVRLLEKTPKNALRVPFLLEVFPDAQLIFLQREPRANLSSMMQAWRAKGWVTYRQLPGWPGPWSLLLPPGYERLQGRPLEEIVAFQWRVANEIILDDLADLPRERWTTVRYEALVADPRAEVGRILEFAGLAMDSRLADYLSKPLPLSKHTQTKPEPDKWKQNAAEIERVMPGLAGIRERIGSQAGG